MFVCCKDVVDLVKVSGMKFSAADGAHCKHTLYKSGVIHMLSTRDGNNELMPVAWGICETESGDSYRWFAELCINCGLAAYLNNKESLIYSDRDKGLEEFHNAFPLSAVGRCFFHIIGNCRQYLRNHKKSEKFADEEVWPLQQSKTQDEFRARLATLRSKCPNAADYFEHHVNAEQVYLWSFLKNNIASFGHKTSNAVEALNGVFVTERHQMPYWFNDLILKWIGEKIHDRLTRTLNDLAPPTVHYLTPWARAEWNNACIQLTHLSAPRFLPRFEVCISTDTENCE